MLGTLLRQADGDTNDNFRDRVHAISAGYPANYGGIPIAHGVQITRGSAYGAAWGVFALDGQYTYLSGFLENDDLDTEPAPATILGIYDLGNVDPATAAGNEIDNAKQGQGRLLTYSLRSRPSRCYFSIPVSGVKALAITMDYDHGAIDIIPTLSTSSAPPPTPAGVTSCYPG